MKNLLTGRTVTVGAVVLLVSLAIGAVAGVGGYTFIYASMLRPRPRHRRTPRLAFRE